MLTAQRDRVTTTEAAQITGRSQDAVRRAINDRYLEATNEGGRWYIDREILAAWDKRARRFEFPDRPRIQDKTAELLAEYYSMSAEELAALAGIHIGNARKHLALLATEGRAQRLDDGQWILTAQQHQGAA